MIPILRNILAVVGGLIVANVVNMGLVTLGPSVIAIPEGADFSTPEGLKKSMPLLSAQHFIFPFLAHALGTLVGAFVAVRIAVSHQIKLALTIGCFFLLGGIMMVVLVGGPIWFMVTDLLLAYLPMSYLGGCLASG
ncbi:MAG: hypothetical protein ABF379_01610, partial [Akkermansiaceae bacterium]